MALQRMALAGGRDAALGKWHEEGASEKRTKDRTWTRGGAQTREVGVKT